MSIIFKEEELDLEHLFIGYWRLSWDRSIVVSGYIYAADRDAAYDILDKIPGCEVTAVYKAYSGPVPSDLCVNFTCFWEDCNKVGYLLWEGETYYDTKKQKKINDHH